MGHAPRTGEFPMVFNVLVEKAKGRVHHHRTRGRRENNVRIDSTTRSCNNMDERLKVLADDCDFWTAPLFQAQSVV